MQVPSKYSESAVKRCQPVHQYFTSTESPRKKLVAGEELGKCFHQVQGQALPGSLALPHHYLCLSAMSVPSKCPQSYTLKCQTMHQYFMSTEFPRKKFSTGEVLGK